MSTTVQPTLGKERIQSLDILRGIAILGILIMNIQSFAMPGAAYLNPTAFGDFEGANYWVWVLSHIFADSKFMTIFSVLFGAGVVLVTQKAEKREGKSAALHYKRNFWLLIIGLLHAHLIWHGDILVAYAICSFLVFFFRKLSPRKLLIIGLLWLSVHSVLYLFFGFSMEFIPEADLQEMRDDFWNPGIEVISVEIAAVTGSLSEQINHTSAEASSMETTVFFLIMFWRAGGLMLVGMALYKWGVLTAERSTAFYKKGIIFGLILGLPIIIWGLIKNMEMGWVMEFSMFHGSQFNYWGSLGVAFAYICGIMLFAKSDSFQKLRDRFAAIGQMALTNYITQSILGILVFYGIGFGLFGQLDRIEQVGVILVIWLLQFLWSKPWLDRFKFGPLEWAWRTATYMKKQPMKKQV